MSELDDAVSATAATLSDALQRLAKPGPKEQAAYVAEKISEAAQDLEAAATAASAPADFKGWADVGPTTIPDSPKGL